MFVMIAVAVLWLALVVLSAWLPYYAFKHNKKWAITAATIGLMLTCGFWLIKVFLEHKKMTDICQQTGATVYVQPEKWKAMLGGEEAWKKLGYRSQNWDSLSHEEQQTIVPQIDFEGQSYEFYTKQNARVLLYQYRNTDDMGTFTSYIYYDGLTQTVLYKINWFKVSPVARHSAFRIPFVRQERFCENGKKDSRNTFEKFFPVRKS